MSLNYNTITAINFCRESIDKEVHTVVNLSEVLHHITNTVVKRCKNKETSITLRSKGSKVAVSFNILP